MSLERLDQTLSAAGIPIHGVARDRVDYRDDATPEQRDQGDAILAAFDWEAEPVPEWVWMFQLRMALRRMLLSEEHPEWGDALSALEAYVANANDADLADQLTAASVRRDHGTVAQIAFLFQWPDSRLDEAFRLAATF